MITSKLERDFKEIIEWLDSNRWNPDNFLHGKETIGKFAGKRELLLFWLCYITDRVKPIEVVWDKNWKILDSIVKDLDDKGEFSQKDVISKFEKISKEMRSNKIPIYPADRGHIINTICILNSPVKDDDGYPLWERGSTISDSFMNFLKMALQRARQMDKPITYIAYLLWLLSYRPSLSGKWDDVKGKIERGETSREELKRAIVSATNIEYHNTSFMTNKRLWASVRDLKKSPCLLHVLEENLDENLYDWWKGLDEKELRLPGDVWNDRFVRKFLNEVYDIKEKSSKKIESKLEEKRKNNVPLPEYDEQFDSSISFMRRICNLHHVWPSICTLCPLSKNKDINKIKSLCLRSDSNDKPPDKFCPLLLFMTGDLIKCNENCIVVKHFDDDDWLNVCDGNFDE